MFDDRIFANNQKTRIITTSDPRSLANQRGSYWIMGAGYFDQFMQITDLLKRKTFTGLLIVYDEEGNHIDFLTCIQVKNLRNIWNIQKIP